MGPILKPKNSTSAPAAPTANQPSHPRDAQDADADTTMADAPTTNTQNPTSTADTKKRKRKEKESHVLHQTTFRRPTWSYFHLTLITPGTAAAQSTASSGTQDIDALTVSTLLLQPLTAYLGITGSAVPIDILHTVGCSAYVRMPRQDARAFRAALSGWIGGCDAGSVPGIEEGGRVRVAWRVVAEGGSLGLLRGGGEEVFGKNGVAY